jgi:hypothetical protein
MIGRNPKDRTTSNEPKATAACTRRQTLIFQYAFGTGERTPYRINVPSAGGEEEHDGPSLDGRSEPEAGPSGNNAQDGIEHAEDDGLDEVRGDPVSQARRAYNEKGKNESQYY